MKSFRITMTDEAYTAFMHRLNWRKTTAEERIGFVVWADIPKGEVKVKREEVKVIETPE